MRMRVALVRNHFRFSQKYLHIRERRASGSGSRADSKRPAWMATPASVGILVLQVRTHSHFKPARVCLLAPQYMNM